MRTTVVTPPTTPLLSASEARLRLQFPDSVYDNTINAYVAAATANLDGPGGEMGRALGRQTLQLQAAHFPGRCWSGHPHFERWPCRDGRTREILLSYPEIVSVTSIEYLDTSGASQTLDPAEYILAGRRVVPAPGDDWPSTQIRPDAVTITYQAGYAPNAVPANVVQAITLMVATMQTMGRSNIALKQETVFGVSSLQWDTTSAANDAYTMAINALLKPLMVYTRDA